ncbi:MAG: hypothetical protein F4185_04115 [Chloroflexi bacterium]|nr:hypothetical protein [Chloroflexota bacterium]
MTLPATPINDPRMTRDGFQLVQEAVSNWESLDGVVGVDVAEFLDNTNEHGYLAKVALLGQSRPVFIQLVLIDPYEFMEMSYITDDKYQATLPGLYEAIFEEGQPVQWRDEPWE